MLVVSFNIFSFKFYSGKIFKEKEHFSNMFAIAILAGDKRRKALLEINNKTLGKVVLDAVKEFDVYKILIARKEVLNFFKDYVDYFDFTSASSFLKNHIKAVNKVKTKGIDEIIFVHCDLPLLTKRSIENFVMKARKEGGNFIIPVCNAKYIEENLPNYSLWKWKARNFDFVVGNVYYFKIGRSKIKNAGLINLLYKYKNKRNPFNWFFILFGFLIEENINLLKYARAAFNTWGGKYDINEISKNISKVLFGDEISYKLIEINDLAIYIDIDNKKDLEIVKNYLNNLCSFT